MVERQRDGNFGQDGKLGHSCARVTKGKFFESWVKDHVVHLGINVRSSAHNCRCVINCVTLWQKCYYYYYHYYYYHYYYYHHSSLVVNNAITHLQILHPLAAFRAVNITIVE